MIQNTELSLQKVRVRCRKRQGHCGIIVRAHTAHPRDAGDVMATRVDSDDSMTQHLRQHARGMDATLQHTRRRLSVFCAGLQASLAAAWPQKSVAARSASWPSSVPASNQLRQLRFLSSRTRAAKVKAEHAPDVSGLE